MEDSSRDFNPLSFNRTEMLLSLIVFTKFYGMGIISLGLLEGFEFALHTCVHFLLFVNQSHCISGHSSRGFLSHVINSNEDIWLIEKKRTLEFCVEKPLSKENWAFLSQLLSCFIYNERVMLLSKGRKGSFV